MWTILKEVKLKLLWRFKSMSCPNVSIFNVSLSIAVTAPETRTSCFQCRVLIAGLAISSVIGKHILIVLISEVVPMIISHASVSVGRFLRLSSCLSVSSFADLMLTFCHRIDFHSLCLFRISLLKIKAEWFKWLILKIKIILQFYFQWARE